MITMINNSSKGLLACGGHGRGHQPGGTESVDGLSYDHFFKEAGIRPAGEDFDAVGADFFDSMNQGCTYMNGVEV